MELNQNLEVDIKIIEQENEETTLYFWEDNTMKQVPYDEYKANSGQVIKTFIGLKEGMKTIVIKIDKVQFILSIWDGIIKNGNLKKTAKPVRFKAVDKKISTDKVCNHKVNADAPVMMISLNKENFGKEIKPKLVI